MKNWKLSILAVSVAGLMMGCSGGDGKAGKADTKGSAFNADKKISVVSREEGSGTRGAFIELFGVESKTDTGGKKDLTTKEAIIANKTDVMLKSVGSDPQAIGYVSMGSLNNTIKAVEIDQVAPSIANVKNGSYKIFRPFNIAFKDDPSGVKKDFITFIMSADGQKVVAQSYIPVDEKAAAYTGQKPEGKIVVAGSSSVSPVMEKLKEAYAKVNPNAKVEIQMSDSTAGMTCAINNTCDIGMASRELKDKEKEQLKKVEFAYDGIAVIVNPQNPEKSLKKEQVKNIFTGQTTQWNKVAQ